MIIQLLLGALLAMLSFLTQILPAVSQLPFGIDAVLVTGMGYFVFVAQVFPPMQSLLNAFVFYYSFKLSLKFFAMLPIVRHMLYKS